MTVDAASRDLNRLRTLRAVHRAGSFTAAAQELGLSQPTVTAQIRSLEDELGRALFERLPRGVEPTPFAHEMVARLDAPLDALELVAGGTCEADGRTAPVHLAGPSELLCTRVLPALAPLVADGVQLRLGEGLTEALLEDLREGREDLVIATRRPRGRALESHALAEEEYVLVTSPAWAQRLAARPASTPLCTALREVPLVSVAEDVPIVRRYWRTVLGRPHPPVGAAVTVPTLHAVHAALTAGAGYSVLPRALVREALAAGELVAPEEPEEPPRNTLYLVVRPGARCNPATDRVVTALQEAAPTW